MSSPGRQPRRPRRSPSPEQRQRDPERTRARILTAATEELSEKGIAGLRVSAIAARAGVNKQLISYYFDGKDGLLRALGTRWRERKRDYDRAEWSFPEVVAAYTHAANSDPVGTRLLGWAGLTYPTGKEHPDLPASAEQWRRDLDDLRRRQRDGELADDLDPACVLLAVVAATAAPTLLPHIAYGITGAEPNSPEFVRHYTEQMTRMIDRLSARRRPPERRE
ncbi:TetR/AcrR family transcriptional regulator [Pseudonocardia acaciae]|uniref:TetR/AcrR family transcriptional regulator n=1 Tax=Pseudonocardia acaciae TaxID=551276 RepID=UPI0005603CD0|nr:helix-turn-helix domain-containing protein [Pseudonocardia acaciae]